MTDEINENEVIEKLYDNQNTVNESKVEDHSGEKEEPYDRDEDGNEKYSINNNGDEYYKKDLKNNDRLIDTVLPEKAYIRLHTNETMYPMDHTGKEFYKILNGIPVAARNETGDAKYAKDSDGNEYYYLGYFVFENKFAKLKNNREIYPRLGNEDLPIIDMYANDESDPPKPYYPQRESGEEYLLYDYYYIILDGKLKYPLSETGYPIYPPNGYILLNGVYQFGKNREGHEMYALDSNGIEYYPPDFSYAVTKEGKLKYAKKNGLVIFPTLPDGCQYYFNINGNDVIDSVYNYARDKNNREIYPIAITYPKYNHYITEERPYEILLYLSSYARDEKGMQYYPLDEFGNEYGEENILPIGYPITKDNRIIVSLNSGTKNEFNIFGKLLRWIGTDYLTKIKSSRKSRSVNLDPYPYQTLSGELKYIHPTGKEEEIKTKYWTTFLFIVIIVVVLMIICYMLFKSTKILNL